MVIQWERFKHFRYDYEKEVLHDPAKKEFVEIE